MPTHKLTLYPKNPEFIIEQKDTLITSLKEIGFIEKHWQTPSQFLVGDKFLSLITFLGCSPYIEITPNDNHNFCYVEFAPRHDTVQFLHAPYTKAPRCRHCKYQEKQWQTIIEQWQQSKTDFVWTCPQCYKESQLHELNWRHCAGFAKEAIYIWNIFEGEAVPNDLLLETLENVTHVKWDYF